MSEITYTASATSDKTLWVYADFDLYQKEMRKLQGRFYKRSQRWSISKKREADLINLIEKVNNIKNRKTQSKYRRAVSVCSDDSNLDNKQQKDESDKEQDEDDKEQYKSDEEQDEDDKEQDESDKEQSESDKEQSDSSENVIQYNKSHRI